MRRSRSRLPIKPVLIVVVLLVLGTMIFNSGILVDIGLLKGNIPEDIGIDPNDPRVIAKVDESIDRNAVRDVVNKLINLITGQEEHGRVTVIAEDTSKGFKLAGFKFELRDAITKEVIETLVTGEDGSATSNPIDYRQAYRIVQIGSVMPYNDLENEIVIEMNAPIMELHYDQNVKNYVLNYSMGEKGIANIDELKLDVPVILQKPELPNGCEITALTSLLNFVGYPVDKVALSDGFLPMQPFYKKSNKLYGADPNVAFSGNPKDPGGWFVYAAPTVKAGENYIQSVSGSHEVLDLTGSTENAIMSYIEQGIPVAVWATTDLSLANFGYGWYLEENDTFFNAATNLHCMVIYGYVGDKLYVMDPLQGEMVYDKTTLFQSYESLGSRAMVVKELQNE
ncbi:C39 family peptidase [Fusibacter bizertensis]